MAIQLLKGELTFFIGTGVGMFLTENQSEKIPNYKKLLKDVCDTEINLIKSKGGSTQPVYEVLEMIDSNTFNLQIISQILDDLCTENGHNSKKIISEIINKAEQNIDLVKCKLISDCLSAYHESSFAQGTSFQFITTNYDEIIEHNLLNDNYTQVSELGDSGKGNRKYGMVYHIHGVESLTQSVVYTLRDYYRIQDSKSYLTNKFYSLLTSGSTVFLGYSLNDFDLNEIILSAHDETEQFGTRQYMYYVVRESVSDVVKKYYADNFRILVLDEINLDEFFQTLKEYEKSAESNLKNMVPQKIVYEGYQYNSEYLHISTSFSDIIASFRGEHLDLNTSEVQDILIHVLEQKKAYTTESGEFDQYVGLANWLITYLMETDFNQVDSKFQIKFTKLVVYSMSTMSEELYIGYSWNAFKVWLHRIDELRWDKKEILERIISDNMSNFNEQNCVDKIAKELSYHYSA